MNLCFNSPRETYLVSHALFVDGAGAMIVELPKIIARHIDKVLQETFVLGITDWNSIFWVAHPGGPTILEQIEAEPKLEKSKLSISCHFLSEYGNMWSASVMFIMDEMKKSSLNKGKATTGNGFDWGVLCGFGPGITIETIVLCSVSI
ncbi:Chalcone synthase 3 [Bienertia sinuspersici]